MTRADILKANGIEMTISNKPKRRLLSNGSVSADFGYYQDIKLGELEDLFGEIKHSEYW